MHEVVHVIPVSTNKESILESIKGSGHPIQKAYLVLSDSNEDGICRIADELENNLKSLVDVQRIFVEMNVYPAAHETLKIIKREQDERNKILLNATGSSGVICLACYIAAQLSGSTFYWKYSDETAP